MQNKQANIQTAILVILTILVAVYLWKLFSMDKRMKEEVNTSASQVVVENDQIVSEPKSETPDTEIPTPTPVDPVVVFLKSLVGQYPNAVINECHWADGRQFMLNKDYRIADGSLTIYNSTGAVMDTCATFYDPETYQPSGVCQAVIDACVDVIYGNAGATFVDVYNLN